MNKQLQLKRDGSRKKHFKKEKKQIPWNRLGPISTYDVAYADAIDAVLELLGPGIQLHSELTAYASAEVEVAFYDGARYQHSEILKRLKGVTE